MNRLHIPGPGLLPFVAIFGDILNHGAIVSGLGETAVDLEAIKARVHECGYHYTGEMLPKHLCAPEDPSANG